jgi:hypothetical protein
MDFSYCYLGMMSYISIEGKDHLILVYRKKLFGCIVCRNESLCECDKDFA